MKAKACLIAWICAALMLTGCWSKMELTERAFVLALAVDKGKKEPLEVTAQIYRPASQFGAPSVQAETTSFVNVTLEGTSVSGIIRNNKTITGRHSQFSHIQIILISEELIKERLSDILDFFYRDPEVRLGTSVMIARGKARDYLTGEAMIENTLGSQVFKQLNFSADLAGRAVNTTILDLAFQLKSESQSAMLPIIKRERKFKQSIVEGIALAAPEKMLGQIPANKTPFLLLLANKFNYGLLDIPCGPEARGLGETIEVLKASSRVTPTLKGDSASARIDVHIEGSTGELVCTSIRSPEDEARYAKKMTQYFKEEMEAVLDMLQKHKADVLGIGHKLYLRHPSRWQKIKKDWPETFARMPIEVNVEVHIVNSKMMSPSPFSKIGEE